MLFFFGWGTQFREWSIGEGRTLVARWKYLSIFFCPVAFNIQWHLQGDSRSQDKVVSYEEVQRILPIGTPQVSFWSRYGLLVLVGAFVAMGLWG